MLPPLLLRLCCAMLVTFTGTLASRSAMAAPADELLTELHRLRSSSVGLNEPREKQDAEFRALMARTIALGDTMVARAGITQCPPNTSTDAALRGELNNLRASVKTLRTHPNFMDAGDAILGINWIDSDIAQCAAAVANAAKYEAEAKLREEKRKEEASAAQARAENERIARDNYCRTAVAPAIGMTEDQAVASTWGEPSNRHKTVTASHVSEQWVYSHGPYCPGFGSEAFLYFEDGVLRAIQD
jgi:hypothetical protein